MLAVVVVVTEYAADIVLGKIEGVDVVVTVAFLFREDPEVNVLMSEGDDGESEGACVFLVAGNAANVACGLVDPGCLGGLRVVGRIPWMIYQEMRSTLERVTLLVFCPICLDILHLFQGYYSNFQTEKIKNIK